MKKLYLIILIVLTTLIVNNMYYVYPNDYSFEINHSESNFEYGIIHEYVEGKLTLNNETSNQVYNLIDFKLSENDDYQLVGVNAFSDFGYGMLGLDEMIDHFEKDNPNLEVLAGFNGGFFHINETGESRNTTIDNYHVIQPMTSPNSTILASYTDGTVEFLDVFPEGYEIIVYNKNNEIKKRVLVDNINKEILSKEGVSIFFDNYVGNISKYLDPIHVKAHDLKHPADRTIIDPDYYRYANGYVTFREETNIEPNSFIIVSEEINELIEEGDNIVYQAYIPGFEDVRYGIGTHANFTLVTNGLIDVKPTTSTTVTAKHPRTAVGIQENGDPFVVVVDGRNPAGGKDGVNFNELAYLMKEYGAITSYNYDGGGSSTLMIRNSLKTGTVNERFDIVNELSDGYIRKIANGYLLVKGKLSQKPITINFPDDRPQLDVVNNVYIDDYLNLHFNADDNSNQFEIIINDLKYSSYEKTFPLKGLVLGENIIKIKSLGTNDFKASNSKEVTYYLYQWQIKDMLDLFKEMFKDEMRHE